MSAPDADPAGRRFFTPLLGIAVVLIVIGAVVGWRLWSKDTEEDAAERMRQARAALAREDFERAEQLASLVSADDPDWIESRLIAGEAATRLGLYDDAIKYYESVPAGDSELAILARYSLAEVYRHVGELSQSLQAYRDVVQVAPGHIPAHHRLALMLELTGQRWLAVPHFMTVLRSGTATLHDLVLFGDLERHMEQLDYLESCAERAPDDALAKSGIAAYEILYGNLDRADRLLQEVVKADPSFVPAQAMLGELLLDRAPERLAAWHRALPAAAEDYPDIWFVRGLFARQSGKFDVAIRCFWEAVRQEPAHRRAMYHLSQVLNSRNHPAADDFAERSGKLVELSQRLDGILNRDGDGPDILPQIVQLLHETGRLWEAMAWSALTAQEQPDANWTANSIARLRQRLTPEMPRTADFANLALKHDFSDYPGPEGLFDDDTDDGPTAPLVRSPTHIRFSESTEAGIEFTYKNGPDPETRGARMFEQTGGGVAVLDFDNDAWPDLYLTQGADWPTGSNAPTRSDAITDRLFRNRDGNEFVDVTRLANLQNLDFGQGPTVGDFNSDGFPDLYVANIGRNRLFVNNGDGTFSDVTESAGFTSDTWSASCVMVDLNSDGHPDLFDANYLTGDGVYTAICQGRACSPSVFPGAPDDLHLNRGDGTFETMPNVTPGDDSKGLGVVAVVLAGDRNPSLFVSNDQVPNFFLRNQTEPGSATVQLSNEGFMRGLAFNEDGLSMACMGIAVDDVDSDGRLDLFVTNFKDEANTLYLQDANGLFIDATRKAGLFMPSFPYVGWGTQFLDADLDGRPDLVVVNGHVDDYRDEGGEYRMVPQFFRNMGLGRFEPLSAEQLGPYFRKKFLGRGLARLDWNRDGKMDFAVSNIGMPAALLTNQSQAGHYLNVRLHATASARDGIGAVVTVKAGNRSYRKQLTAGDGYMASNERMLQFGLGAADAVDSLTIEWPSGTQRVIDNPPVDVTLELVEGADLATVWRDQVPTSLRLAP